MNDKYTEPARTIGETFASKAMLRTYVSATVAVVAGALNKTVSDAMVDNITLIVMFLAMATTAIIAKLEQRKLAKAQAEETRDAVYSPATVDKLVEKAAETQQPDVPPPPGDFSTVKF